MLLHANTPLYKNRGRSSGMLLHGYTPLYKNKGSSSGMLLHAYTPLYKNRGRSSGMLLHGTLLSTRTEAGLVVCFYMVHSSLQEQRQV